MEDGGVRFISQQPFSRKFNATLCEAHLNDSPLYLRVATCDIAALLLRFLLLQISRGGAVGYYMDVLFGTLLN